MLFEQETQESIREAIECQPVPEQRAYDLGSDADGNTYLHFPQFCGQDVRVYRQAPIKMPKLEKPKIHKEKFSITVVSELFYAGMSIKRKSDCLKVF